VRNFNIVDSSFNTLLNRRKDVFLGFLPNNTSSIDVLGPPSTAQTFVKVITNSAPRASIGIVAIYDGNGGEKFVPKDVSGAPIPGK
jgi:hypothetical protein